MLFIYQKCGRLTSEISQNFLNRLRCPIWFDIWKSAKGHPLPSSLRLFVPFPSNLTRNHGLLHSLKLFSGAWKQMIEILFWASGATSQSFVWNQHTTCGTSGDCFLDSYVSFDNLVEMNKFCFFNKMFGGRSLWKFSVVSWNNVIIIQTHSEIWWGNSVRTCLTLLKTAAQSHGLLDGFS